jgi:LL-diaminopimelate aminotransferase
MGSVGPPRPSERFERLPPYPLADVPGIKRDLLARGVDLIDLGVGDADLAPPPAAVAALAEGAGRPAFSRYAFQLGLPEYREEVSVWMGRRFGVTLDPYTEVLPLLGSKEGLFHLPAAYLQAGDVALVPDPGYQPYLGGTLLVGAEPFIVPLRRENGFLLEPWTLPREVLRRAKLLFLNYPNNPTTAVAPREYLERIIGFCRQQSILLAYDNAYSEVAFDGYVPPSILEFEGSKEVAIEFHSLSKTYNMTGWRVGWAAGGATAIAALSRVKSFADTGVPFVMQHAAVAALRSHETWLPGNLEVFRRRRDSAVAILRDAGFAVDAPPATMYLWVALPGHSGSEAFARRLLLEQGVAVLPGAALGPSGEGFVRIALTVSEERLVEAAKRIGHMR